MKTKPKHTIPAHGNAIEALPLLMSENLTTSQQDLPIVEILVITSYPPRECGIATYSQDLIRVLDLKFKNSFKLTICPIESNTERHFYLNASPFNLNTDQPDSFLKLANQINANPKIGLVLVQHEFGFFSKQKEDFVKLLKAVSKPIILVFHTVLPRPDDQLQKHVCQLAELVEAIVVMTRTSMKILLEDYGLNRNLITVIPHGTHLVTHADKDVLKNLYGLSGKKILSTFGLLSSGKSIETTLEALPEIVKNNKNVLFLIIGKTHPGIVKQEGESYREMLLERVKNLGISDHVLFINQFLSLPVLLDYLQLTDIYLFTSKDPNQAVSGTFSYAISCGCPVITTPIPHALEALKNSAGISIAFSDHEQLAQEVIHLFNDHELRKQISSNGLHYMASTAWENSALAHANLFKTISSRKIELHYKLPELNLNHFKNLTTDFGMIQFSMLNHPDKLSGYTLDDNARALVAICQHFELTLEQEDVRYIKIYLDFIGYCLDGDGSFKNYVSIQKKFTSQNDSVNLADARGRAIWALGYTLQVSAALPIEIVNQAKLLFERAILNVDKIFSTRAMAFIVKGLYYANRKQKVKPVSQLITLLANRLVQMYRHEAVAEWRWFESYLTYGNSILPEALLCAWQDSGNDLYRDIAESSFDFLLSKTITKKSLVLISNMGWLHKGEEGLRQNRGGEQPIDAAYSIVTLGKFYEVFKKTSYLNQMNIAFEWFLGNNHLRQIIYNPSTGGCYDGLEKDSVNLNQGAESTVSYLMARLTVEKTRRPAKWTIKRTEDFSERTSVSRTNGLKMQGNTFTKEI